MSGGVLFVVCIPTEAAERKLLSANGAITPEPDRDNQQTTATSNGGPCEAKKKSPRLAPAEDGTTKTQFPFSMKSPLLQKDCGIFHPTPKSSSTGATRRATGSREVLVQIENNPPTDYDHQSTVTSIDDIAVGMPSHADCASLKRTKSDNALSQHDDEDLPTLSSTLEHNGTIRKSWDGYIKGLMLSTKKLKSPLAPAASAEPSLNIENRSSMEMVMREILKKMRLRTAVWQQAADAWQIVFSLEAGYAQERVLTMLTEWGIGEREGSSVSMVPCTVLMHKPEPERDDDGEVLDEQEVYDKTAGAWDRFMNSMRARLNVAQIVEGVKQDATITFDFVSLLVIAAVLAAFGLVENSTIFLASSMLISPLMGPIIAATFGTVIKDHQLTKFGIVNELIGILLTTAVGFVFGLIVFNVDDSFSRGEGLTSEMLSRTDTHSLIVGIFIAIPSGAAVAISILGENIGSLVGVAISASLLPPAVNSGLLWALAVMFMCHQEDASKYNVVIESSKWSTHQAVELFVLGAISMAVTISNVICVYAAGTLFLKIKEVAPIVSSEHRQFWKHDVKVARDFNNKSGTAGGGATATGSANAAEDQTVGSLTQKWVDEFGDFAGTDVERLGLNAEMLRNVGRPAYQQTWSPRTLRHHQFHAGNDSKRSLEEFEQLYLNMAHPLQNNPSMARHFSISGPSKTVMYKRNSPPKYRSLLHDHIFSTAAAAAAAQQRRSSMPYYMGSSSTTGTSTPPPMSRFTRLDETAGAGARPAIARLGHILEVASPASSPRSVASTSVQAASPLSVDNSHLTFERRAAAARASGRKFIVTPASEDPLLERKNAKE